MLVSLVNPVNATVASGAGAQATPAAPLKIVASKTFPTPWRVCPISQTLGKLLVNETVVARFFLETEIKATAKSANAPPKPAPPLSLGSALVPSKTPSSSPRPRPAKKVPPPKLLGTSPVSSLQLSAAAGGDSTDAVAWFVANPLTESRTPVNVGAVFTSPGARTKRATSFVTDSSGCITLTSLTLNSVKASQRLRLVFTARGVDSTPIGIVALTLADANPVSPADLKTRITVPLFLALPLFLANTMWASPNLRLLPRPTVPLLLRRARGGTLAARPGSGLRPTRRGPL